MEKQTKAANSIIDHSFLFRTQQNMLTSENFGFVFCYGEHKNLLKNLVT